MVFWVVRPARVSRRENTAGRLIPAIVQPTFSTRCNHPVVSRIPFHCCMPRR